MVWATPYDDRIGEFDSKMPPGQQLLAAHSHTTLEHLLNLDIKSPPACQRLTGILASIGKACHDVETMEDMIRAGMNIALINFAYGHKEEHVETIKMLRQAAKNISMKVGSAFPLGIAARLSGRKIRTGRIAESLGDSVELKTGDVVRLTSDETYRDRCSSYTVFVDFIRFSEQMKKGNKILIDNEAIMLVVEIISATTLTCKIEQGGTLGSYKVVFIPNVTFDMPNFSEKDKDDIEIVVNQQLDIIIMPFVHNAEVIQELKTLLGDRGRKILIAAKVQTNEGYKHFDEILGAANAIVISRQELGTDITPKKLVIAQKNMIARANKANVPVIVSAQLLSSMTTKKLPLRAELLDISNCILDGADGLILSTETSIGEFPADTIAVLATTCKEAEACVWTRQIYSDLLDKTTIPCDQLTATSIAAVLASQKTIASAIIVVTTSGKSAQAASKYRPRCPIIAVTRYPMIARQLHMWRGVIPIVYEENPNPDWHIDLENRVKFSVAWGMDKGFIRSGDAIVVVSGWRQGSGFTNTMKVIYATSEQ